MADEQLVRHKGVPPRPRRDVVPAGGTGARAPRSPAPDPSGRGGGAKGGTGEEGAGVFRQVSPPEASRNVSEMWRLMLIGIILLSVCECLVSFFLYLSVSRLPQLCVPFLCFVAIRLPYFVHLLLFFLSFSYYSSQTFHSVSSVCWSFLRLCYCYRRTRETRNLERLLSPPRYIFKPILIRPY